MVGVLLHLARGLGGPHAVADHPAHGEGAEHLPGHLLGDADVVHVQPGVRDDHTPTYSVHGMPEHLALEHPALRPVLAGEHLHEALHPLLLVLGVDGVTQPHDRFNGIVDSKAIILKQLVGELL